VGRVVVGVIYSVSMALSKLVRSQMWPRRKDAIDTSQVQSPRLVSVAFLMSMACLWVCELLLLLRYSGVKTAECDVWSVEAISVVYASLGMKRGFGGSTNAEGI
jgi:hypothetical protein